MADQRLEFSNKTALVVGGTSGIGNAVAARLRDDGATVYIWGRRKTLDDYGEEDNDFDGMHFTQVDVTDVTQVNATEVHFDELDILVLSQGTSALEDGISEYEPVKFAQVLDVNVTSLMHCCNRFKGNLRQAGGNVVMISSMAALMALPEVPAYCASKYAVTGLCRSLALGWVDAGIRVNAVAPGRVPSRMIQSVIEDPEMLRAALANNPMGRTATLSEIADAVQFLGSGMATYITGQTLVVDGGHSLLRP